MPFTQDLPPSYWLDDRTRYLVVCLPSTDIRDERERAGSAQTIIASGFGRIVSLVRDDPARVFWWIPYDEFISQIVLKSLPPTTEGPPTPPSIPTPPTIPTTLITSLINLQIALRGAADEAQRFTSTSQPQSPTP